MTRDNKFFINRYGQYAAWPLHSPAMTEYGRWAYVEVIIEGSRDEVQFVRALSSSEVGLIQSRFLIWGIKLINHPFALLAGRPSEFMNSSSANLVSLNDNSRSVGV